MEPNQLKNGIHPGRLSADKIADNFTDLHPPLTDHEALVAADRCYFCYDAPCMMACPTGIDIPMFIRQISTGNTKGSAKTIFEQNILGGMCARVCPTETLCEQACVREIAEGKPVQIGLLQRFATDRAMDQELQFFGRAEATGKMVAIVGAGPAGLACSHRLSMHGHDVKIFEAKEKPGGLNEFGIAAYKSTEDFAQSEVDWITDIGGIEILYGQKLGTDFTVESLNEQFDAVFLGLGLSSVNDLGLNKEEVDGSSDAVDFIADLRQSDNKEVLSVGRRIVVIGGGMTAVDAAVQAKLLGAEEVTICYRRGAEQMNASMFEQQLAASSGVVMRHWLQPKELVVVDGQVAAIELEYTDESLGKLKGTGETVTLAADQVLGAIGQVLTQKDLDQTQGPKTSGGRVEVDGEGRTSMEGVWAGGDCTNQGEDLTVTAVAQGRDAAESIHNALSI